MPPRAVAVFAANWLPGPPATPGTVLFAVKLPPLPPFMLLWSPAKAEPVFSAARIKSLRVRSVRRAACSSIATPILIVLL